MKIKIVAAIFLLSPFGINVAGEVGTGEPRNVSSEDPASETESASGWQVYLDMLVEAIEGDAE